MRAKKRPRVSALELSTPIYCENLSQHTAPKEKVVKLTIPPGLALAISLAAGVVIRCGIIMSSNRDMKSSLLQNPVYSGASSTEKTRAKSERSTKTGKLKVSLLLCCKEIPVLYTMLHSASFHILCLTVMSSAHLSPCLFMKPCAQAVQATVALRTSNYSAKFMAPSRSLSTAIIRSEANPSALTSSSS